MSSSSIVFRSDQFFFSQSSPSYKQHMHEFCVMYACACLCVFFLFYLSSLIYAQ